MQNHLIKLQGNYRKFRELYEKALVSHLEYVNYENSYVAAKGQYEAAKALFKVQKAIMTNYKDGRILAE